MKKIGIFGGSFNPIHVGHLAVAEEAKKVLGLDKVIFVPAGNPYMKDQKNMLDYSIREAMVNDAIHRIPYFEVSGIEGATYKPSYTSETLKYFHEVYKNAKLYLIVGEDAYYQLHNWHDVDTILDLATIAVIRRECGIADFIDNNGWGFLEWKKTEQAKKMDYVVINLGLAVSSSFIRAQIENGKSFRFLVPNPVYRRIVNDKLYGYQGDENIAE